MFKALQALSASLPTIPQDPSRLRSLPDVGLFVPGVVAYYQATQDEGAIWVLALLLARPLDELRERLDPNIEPSWLWEWLRGAAREGLKRPLVRVESRLIHRVEARDAERRALAGQAQEMADPSIATSIPGLWISSRLDRLWEILTPQEQQVAWLVIGLDYTQEEAAAELAVNVSTIRRRLARVKVKGQALSAL